MRERAVGSRLPCQNKLKMYISNQDNYRSKIEILCVKKVTFSYMEVSVKDIIKKFKFTLLYNHINLFYSGQAPWTGIPVYRSAY